MKGHLRIKRQLEDERIDKIIQMKIAGRTIEAIATELKMTRSTVHRLLKKETAQLKMLKTRQKISEVADKVAKEENEKIIRSVEEKLKLYGEEALDRQRDMLDSKNELVVVKAASDLMDRDARLSRTRNTKVSGGVLHAFITPEQLAAAAQTAREIQTMGVAVPALPITAETMGLIEEEVVVNAGTD